jgi:hypothetical protein
MQKAFSLDLYSDITLPIPRIEYEKELKKLNDELENGIKRIRSKNE